MSKFVANCVVMGVKSKQRGPQKFGQCDKW